MQYLFSSSIFSTFITPLKQASFTRMVFENPEGLWQPASMIASEKIGMQAPLKQNFRNNEKIGNNT